MGGLVRFGISIPGPLLESFDGLIEGAGYANRSEAIRDLIRNRLVDAAWEGGAGEMIGTLTLVYDHHVHELGDALTGIQHQHHAAILSTLHIHLDAHLCLEVLVLRGPVPVIKRIADSLTGIRGVKHGKLTVTSAGHL
ncbi:MAG TPA: nickel-responsive transcriptional regulator NikR [bacterium]